MRKITCTHCQNPFPVREEQLGQDVTCPNCNTRQRATADAPHASPEFVVEHVTRALPKNEPPHYMLILIGAGIFMVAGVITLSIGIIAAFITLASKRPEGLLVVIYAIVSGVGSMALGQLMLCIRDIARNTWRGIR